jgi:hypothetical protein
MHEFEEYRKKWTLRVTPTSLEFEEGRGNDDYGEKESSNAYNGIIQKPL